MNGKWASDSLLAAKNGAHSAVIERKLPLSLQQEMDTFGVLMNTVYMYSTFNYRMALLPPGNSPSRLRWHRSLR